MVCVGGASKPSLHSRILQSVSEWAKCQAFLSVETHEKALDLHTLLGVDAMRLQANELLPMRLVLRGQ